MSKSKESKELKKIKVGIYQLQAYTDHAKFKDKGFVKYGKNFNDDVIELDFLDKTNLKFTLQKDRIKYNGYSNGAFHSKTSCKIVIK